MLGQHTVFSLNKLLNEDQKLKNKITKNLYCGTYSHLNELHVELEKLETWILNYNVLTVNDSWNLPPLTLPNSEIILIYSLTTLSTRQATCPQYLKLEE